MPRVFRLVSGQNQHKRDPQTKRQQTLGRNEPKRQKSPHRKRV
jgi:hypothetical protein